ncbi:MAG: hypothetical protein AUG51_21245 [Acidobacteria bacterium 13_1_20CM_3_53_8]|nr:MAG: hypothetical protein AUG51_21245 [Acidobacteria bacterium 13_1_20CM_3_53_8]
MQNKIRKSGGKPAFPTYEVMGVERFKFQSSRLLISLVWKAGLPQLFLPYFIVQFGIRRERIKKREKGND